MLEIDKETSIISWQKSLAASFVRFVLILILLGQSVAGTTQDRAHQFRPGEKLTYNMKFGWFNIGEAVVWLDPEFQYPDNSNRPHYRLQFQITTASWFRVFAKLSFCMESLIDAETLRPYRSDRDLEAKNEIDIRHDYYRYADSVYIEAYIEDVDRWKYHQFPTAGPPVYGAMSTFMFIRNMEKKKWTESIELRTFFTNHIYPFIIRPQGETTHKFNGKQEPVMEFEMVFPESEYFEKEKTGKLLVTTDSERLPLRVEIDMRVGSFILDLDRAEYLR